MVVVVAVEAVVVAEVVEEEVTGAVVVVSAGFSFGSLDMLQWKSRVVDEAMSGCDWLFHFLSLSDFNLWGKKKLKL